MARLIVAEGESPAMLCRARDQEEWLSVDCRSERGVGVCRRRQAVDEDIDLRRLVVAASSLTVR